jgi:MFS family permease
MATAAIAPPKTQTAAKMSWLPIIIIALAQIIIVANTSTVAVSVGAMAAAFGTPATTVQSAIVVYSLVTAAFMILGGKLGALLGSKRVFQGALLVYGAALALVAISQSSAMLLGAETLAGLGAAALVPAMVALIAANYQGKQQALAIGMLGAAGGIGGAAALLVAGFAGAALGWRVPFWILVALAAVVLLLSLRLKPAAKQQGIGIDWLGVLLSAAAIILLTVGVNGIGMWGLFLAKPAAPFSFFGLSPTLVLVVAGVLLGWGFFTWQQRRAAQRKTPLLSPAVVDSSLERMTLIALLFTLMVGAGLGFLLPLYTQIVQGSSSIGSALAMLPYALAVFVAAIFVTRLIGPLTVRQIARRAFIVMAIGLIVVGIAIQNEWSNIVVILGLIATGLGQGALMTVLSNVLVSASSAELAGEVGGLRGTVSNLGAAMGTAVTSALLIGLLAGALSNAMLDSTVLRDETKDQVELSHPAFISNAQLETTWSANKAVRTEEVVEAVRINTEGRLTALKITFFVLAAISLLGLIPSGGLPAGAQQPPSVTALPAGKKPASAKRP